MQDSYRIMSQNDVERRGGMSEAFITVCLEICCPILSYTVANSTKRGMLSRLAATLRSRQTGAEGGAAQGENTTIVVDDNCVVCSLSPEPGDMLTFLQVM